jgi:hypothetical protein
VLAELPHPLAKETQDIVRSYREFNSISEFDPALFNNPSIPMLIYIISHDEEYCEPLIQLHKAEPFFRS